MSSEQIDMIKLTGTESNESDTIKSGNDIKKEEGNQAYRNNNYRLAIQKYTESLEINPNQAVVYSNRAAAYLGMKLYLAAQEDAEKAIMIEPKYIKGYIRLAAAYEGQLNWKMALNTYDKALLITPNDKALISAKKSIENRINSPNSIEAIVGPDIAKRIKRDEQLNYNSTNPDFLDMLKDIFSDPRNMSKYTGQPLYEKFMKVFMQD